MTAEARAAPVPSGRTLNHLGQDLLEDSLFLSASLSLPLKARTRAEKRKTKAAVPSTFLRTPWMIFVRAGAVTMTI
jgi:hypothetical protein